MERLKYETMAVFDGDATDILESVVFSPQNK